MKPEDTLELTCQKCRAAWRPMFKELETVGEFYKGLDDPDLSPRLHQYRVQCPACHTYWIVDVAEEEGADG